MTFKIQLLISLVCFAATLCGQVKDKSYYLARSNDAFTKAFGNVNWQTYYRADTTDISFDFAPENTDEDEQVDSIVAPVPKGLTVRYDFSLPEIYGNRSTDAGLDKVLRFDMAMTLLNAEETGANPEFIRNPAKYRIILPERARQTAKDYNLKKGLVPWEYSLYYNDTTNILYWDVYSMLTEETMKDYQYGECMYIDAFTGNFIVRYDVVTYNLTAFPEKYKAQVPKPDKKGVRLKMVNNAEDD